MRMPTCGDRGEVLHHHTKGKEPSGLPAALGCSPSNGGRDRYGP